MKYSVYIVRSQTTGRHYVGVTSDVARRLEDHNRGKSHSVRGRGPFELALVEEYDSRAEATRRERQIKSFKGGQAFKQLVKNPVPRRPSMSPSSSG